MSVAAKVPRSLGELYDLATGDEDARVCKDIPDEACQHQPRNYFAYLLANTLSKVADELSSARLVFPWMLAALGAPSVFAGLMVPLREAGVLLPQLAVAAWIRRLPQRKRVWLVGAGLSALALVLCALTALTLSGTVAGVAILLWVTLYSLARGLCSVAAKDVLGKTVSKSRRGSLMGYATSAAGFFTLLLGIGLHFGGDALDGDRLFPWFLLAAAALWMLGLLAFATINEVPGATAGGGNAWDVAREGLGLMRSDVDFRRFVVARALLLPLALAPPFYTVLAQQAGSGAAGLGLLILASGLAATLSSPIWGRWSDRSSRAVMQWGSLLGGLLGIVATGIALWRPALLATAWLPAALFFAIAVCHAGVRLGRKVYLVDMATSENRAAYVAVSNTLIGALMLLGGAVGLLGDWLGVAAVLGFLGLLSVGGALYIATIRDVSG